MAGLESLAIDGIGTAFGLPPGTASTAVSTITKIFGIKDLSCIGGQAFNKQTLESFLATRKQRMQAVTNTQQYADFLTDLTIEIGQSELELPRYSSVCSKDYRNQYLTKVKELFSLFYVPNKFKEQKTSMVDFKGGTLNYTKFSPITLEAVTLSDNGAIFQSSVNVQQTIANDYLNQLMGQNQVSSVSPVQNTTGLESQILPSELTALQTYATTNGLQLTDLIPKFLNGQITVQNGKVIWGVSATNQEPTNQYLLFGAIGLIAFALLRKKK